MIYGNAVMLGGGGGGITATDAILRVQAPAGSTVTITKGTTTKTDLGHENADDHTVYDYYFIIHASQFDSQNAWTVTATLGTQTATSTVIVDAADEYDVILSYHVPSGYQEVEYLQSSGSQHLMTTLTPNLVASGEFKYMLLAYVGYAGVWGACANQFNVGCLGWTASNTGAQGLGFGTSYIPINANALNTIYEVSFTAVSGAQSVDVNGTQYSGTLTGSPSSTSTIALYGISYNSATKSNERMNGRIYYLRLYDTNGDIIFEGYPCYRKSDNVAGMWDKVSETFLTNMGTGSFTVGGDVN